MTSSKRALASISDPAILRSNGSTGSVKASTRLIFSDCFPYGLKSIRLILCEVYQAGGCPLQKFTSPGGGEKHWIERSRNPFGAPSGPVDAPLSQVDLHSRGGWAGECEGAVRPAAGQLVVAQKSIEASFAILICDQLEGCSPPFPFDPLK